MTQDTVLLIGSITKIFNATLLMQLVDAGAIDLGAPVLRYLPDLRLKDPAALGRITVQMLLNHTSGIDGQMLPDHGHDEETIEKGIARFAGLGQIFAPGTEYSYCNAATVIAGYLAQRVSGRSWYRLVRERIFEPLQMQHAATLPEEALLHRASVGHYLNPVAGLTPTRTSFAFLPMSFSPGGTTLMMSARDLLTFARAHIDRGLGPNAVRILSEQSARAMQRRTVVNRGKGYTNTDIGIGWMLAADGMLQHSGGGPGIVAVLYAQPEREFAAAILTNAEHGLSVINEIMEPWLKELGSSQPLGCEAVARPAQEPELDFSRYVGVYENVSVRYFVAPAGRGLTLSSQAKFAPYESISTDATPPTRLISLGDEKFLLESADRRFEAFRVFSFRNPDAAGRMRHLGNTERLFLRVD
jgi:CubicO group peptidase (beta-lactamase class C family)